MATDPSSLQAASNPMFIAGEISDNPHTAALRPKLGVSGAYEDYDPGITQEIDRAIRHLPGIVHYVATKAKELAKATGSPNFEVILQNKPETQRPRAYVAPANGKGIREEKTQAVLLKAALGMAGK
jgi:hypothetical protein